MIRDLAPALARRGAPALHQHCRRVVCARMLLGVFEHLLRVGLKYQTLSWAKGTHVYHGVVGFW